MMLTRVEGLAGEVTDTLSALDPDAVAVPDAAALWAQLDRIERAAAGAKLRMARRVEVAGGWRRHGDPSAAHWLARTAGTSLGQARDQLDASHRLVALPATEHAVRHGELSAAQATAVADAAAVAPQREGELLGYAGRDTLRELRERCARAKAAARGAQGADRHAAIHRARTCGTAPTADGGAQLWARGTVDAIARIRAAIDAHADEAFRTARAQGRREPSGAYLFDGLAAMAAAAAGQADTGGATTAPAHKVLVHLDWDAFARGWPTGGERCEIPGLGALPVTIVKAMIASGDAVLAAVVTKGVDVVNVAHLGRKPTAHQRSALEWLAPTCMAEGCDRTITETDHTEDWARTHITLLKWLERICDHHHDLKTHHGWKLVAGTGKRPMVPPDHPDHPDRAPPHQNNTG